MKRFLKLNVFAIATLLFLGVADAWGLGIKKNVNLNQLTAEGDKGSWNPNTKEMKWTDSSWNLFFLADWTPNNNSNVDLSAYDKMVINTSEANGNYRVVIRVEERRNDVDYTCVLSGDGEHVINLTTDFKNGNKTLNSLKNVKSIRIGGYSKNGSVKINSMYFHKSVDWDANGQMTFYATDFNVGENVTKNAENFTFATQWSSITLDFDSDGLATGDLASVDIKVTTNRGGYYPVYEQNANTWSSVLTEAQNAGVRLGTFRICANSDNTQIAFKANDKVTFKKVKPSFDVTADRLYFEDFEKLSDASFLDGKNAPTEAPTTSQQGKYYLYGGRGKILKDPTFGKYYQNLADADEYTKSLSENFLRYTFTDAQRTNIKNAIAGYWYQDGFQNKYKEGTGAATIGFWVNGQVAVDYELPLERGSMFCIFSNDRFRKATDFNERPRFMFDLSCNGWTYLYMPNTNSDGVDIGWNEFIYGEKARNSGVANPLQSLFGKGNYTNPLDQSKHKFYDDKKWHYVTYVMDNNLMRITIYLDGKKTGEIADWSKLPEAVHKDKTDKAPKGTADLVGRTEYLRNIILGGFTPHGLFYDQQFYSDAALAYDDISIYGRALTQEEILSIIEQKQYTPKEWHYGSSFAEYNESKGGNEDPKDVSGLGVGSSFDESGNLLVSAGKLTIPNVPKNYYVRVEYYGNNKATSSASSNLVYVGRRDETISGIPYNIATYKANEPGSYQLDIKTDIKIRSIVITPYQYAVVKFGKWNSATSFTPLENKYVTFNVERKDGINTYYNAKNKENLGSNPDLPKVSLRIDGKQTESKGKFTAAYEDTENGYKDGIDNPYIKYTSTAPHVAYVDKEGNITMTGIAGNTSIIAELISDNLFNGSEVVDSFEIRIKKEENTFRLVNGQTVSANEKFPSADSDKNLQNITLTIGGWNYNNKYNIPGVGDVKDSWNAAKTWRGKVKPTQEILDEFNQYIMGNNAAKSESLGRDDGEFYPGVALENNITPWTLPCRGAYAKFEPLKAGIVTMYLLQKGNLNTVVTLEEKDYSTKVDWRPVYITDETGKIVDFVQTATNGRITYNDNFFVGDKRRAQFIESIDETYSETLRQDLLNLRDKDNDKFHTLIDNWNNAGWRQKVIPTGDGGYMVMSTAIVRYTFNVYPGKTYYLFSNQTQIGISGFNFEEDRLLDTKTQNYETAPVREVKVGNELNFTDVLNEKQPTIPTGGDDITHVTYERNFAQGKWSSICLPFSMNNRQLREQFGEESAVVLLKEIHDDGKIELIWHVNQDIIAGYPYFILPKGEVKHDNVSNSTITKISVDTYFNSEIKKEKPLFSVGSNGNTFNWQGSYNGECYKADYPYVFEGNYEKVELPAGSYVMANSGNLTKIKNATTAKPFRAYLKYQGSNSNNAKPLYTSINWQNEETTSIDDLMFENGILTESTDVYGIDGTVIRRDAQNISNLSKGVYIVNGKKFVVK